MKIVNLDTKKYKRFFAFGCSFTNYKWPTWADIIGQEIEFYENWGRPMAGNHYIFNSVVEADSKYNFDKDDLVMIFWSMHEREDRYHNNTWLNAPSRYQEKTYGKEWFKKFALDLRGFLIRDLAYMKSIQSLLNAKSCDWANFMWMEFFKSSTLRETLKDYDKDSLLPYWKQLCLDVYQGREVPRFFDNRDVISLYQSVFTNIDGVYKWFADENIKSRIAPDDDIHPLPTEALQFLDYVWPNNTISTSTRQYIMNYDLNEELARPPLKRL